MYIRNGGRKKKKLIQCWRYMENPCKCQEKSLQMAYTELVELCSITVMAHVSAPLPYIQVNLRICCIVYSLKTLY